MRDTPMIKNTMLHFRYNQDRYITNLSVTKCFNNLSGTYRQLWTFHVTSATPAATGWTGTAVASTNPGPSLRWVNNRNKRHPRPGTVSTRWWWPHHNNNNNNTIMDMITTTLTFTIIIDSSSSFSWKWKKTKFSWKNDIELKLWTKPFT